MTRLRVIRTLSVTLIAGIGLTVLGVFLVSPALGVLAVGLALTSGSALGLRMIGQVIA